MIPQHLPGGSILLVLILVQTLAHFDEGPTPQLPIVILWQQKLTMSVEVNYDFHHTSGNVIFFQNVNMGLLNHVVMRPISRTSMPKGGCVTRGCQKKSCAYCECVCVYSTHFSLPQKCARCSFVYFKLPSRFTRKITSISFLLSARAEAHCISTHAFMLQKLIWWWKFEYVNQGK